MPLHRQRRRVAGSARSLARAASALAPARSASLRDSAREYVWLLDLRDGVSPAEIAERSGTTLPLVRAGLKRAMATESAADRASPGPSPVLYPLFPVGAFTPGSTCPHSGPSPRHPFVCMVCHRSESDRHPALQRPGAL